MNTRQGFRRWLANRLMEQSTTALPPSHQQWGAAMRNEMELIDEDKQLQWAAGCLRASYTDRLRKPDLSGARVLLALGLLLLAFGDTFAAALTASYRLNFLHIAEFLGSFTPGDDFRRLIPLMDGLPLWLHALSVIAAASYLVAIMRLFFHGKAPYVPVLFAVALEVAADRLGSQFVDAIGVRANPNPSLLAILFPVLFPLALAACLWSISQRQADPVQRQP